MASPGWVFAALANACIHLAAFEDGNDRKSSNRNSYIDFNAIGNQAPKTSGKIRPDGGEIILSFEGRSAVALQSSHSRW